MFHVGSLITLRGNLYYFHWHNKDTNGMSPVYKILENGTGLELNVEPPFIQEFNVDPVNYGLFTFKNAMYYRRNYIYKIKLT